MADCCTCGLSDCAELCMRPVKKARRIAPWHGLMLWQSVSRRVDGLWIGALLEGDKAETALKRVEDALSLIKTYDRPRYEHLRRDLERVWILVLNGSLASYNEKLRTCELDPRHVLDENASLEVVAATIVHEATHARLLRFGIGYDEEKRSRVEAVCFRRERAFAARLPNGEQVREIAERQLTRCTTNDYWTDAAFNARFLDDGIAALRYLGAPEWLVRSLPLLLAVRRWCRRNRRRPASRAGHARL